MSRIEKRFSELKKENRKGLILFLTAGDPSLSITEKLIPKIFDAGADIIELGIPFSDPLADGPTIQKSFVRALSKGVCLKDILAMVKRVRKKTDKPLVFMSAFNLVYKYGISRFAKDASSAGLDGIILPDLIPEEAENVIPVLKKAGIDPIFLAAPTSDAKRLKKIAEASKGFLYYISVKGITGDSKPSAVEVGKQVLEIKKTTALPVACGFGISTPKEAAKIGAVADAVVVGSALVKIVGEKGTVNSKIENAVKFVKALRGSLDKTKRSCFQKSF